MHSSMNGKPQLIQNESVSWAIKCTHKEVSGLVHGEEERKKELGQYSQCSCQAQTCPGTGR